MDSRREREKKRDRHKDRDRSPRKDKRNRSPQNVNEKNVTPNSTIMLRCLPTHISENDIKQDILSYGLFAKDIRLIKKKESGASRGFACGEFSKIEDAKLWMESKQGILLFQDQSRAIMQYSIPRDGREFSRVLYDWICANCGIQNFRRRNQCFKCNGPKTNVDVEGTDEISLQPTGIVLLRGLDALTSEDSVLNCLKTITQLPIKSIRIGRDNLTNMSRGVCYVEMNSISDAMFLHNQLLGNPILIDGKLTIVSYYRFPQMTNCSNASVANTALAAAHWSHQGIETSSVQPQNFIYQTEEEIEKLAQYSADLYAKTPEEKISYLKYYRSFYQNRNQNSDRVSSWNKLDYESNHNEKKKHQSMVIIEGNEYKRYPTPDIKTYSYDETSGYYYDPLTTFYYDPSSRYYFNSLTNHYMYWCSKYHVYLPVSENRGDEKKSIKTKKVHVHPNSAKEIAKNMERWAKSQNVKKISSTSSPSKPQLPNSKSSCAEPNSGSEDAELSLMNKKKIQTLNSESSESVYFGENEQTNNVSDSDDKSALCDAQHSDWKKFACLLCKRQFSTKQKLEKHNKVSDMHRQNLKEWSKMRLSKGFKNQIFPDLHYRDRAKERRLKFGEVDVLSHSLKEKSIKIMKETDTYSISEKSIDDSNIGNKLLRKMGWEKGLGLGKSNQGGTSILEAEPRSGQAGLGCVNVKLGSNDSYKDAAKRILYQRYE